MGICVGMIEQIDKDEKDSTRENPDID
jgi:hypothetical protein